MNTKHFYFIQVNGQWIGMNKQLTTDFNEAHTYQGNSQTMIDKLVKQGYNENDIEVFSFELKEAAIKAIIRERRIDEVLNN